MNKKLTLSLDNSVIGKAKNYAQNHNESLSHIVENYFRFITSEIKDEKKEIAPLVEELLGSIKAPEDFDYDQTKFSYLEKKYLND